jgi:hypothetical protein
MSTTVGLPLQSRSTRVMSPPGKQDGAVLEPARFWSTTKMVH